MPTILVALVAWPRTAMMLAAILTMTGQDAAAPMTGQDEAAPMTTTPTTTTPMTTTRTIGVVAAGVETPTTTESKAAGKRHCNRDGAGTACSIGAF